MKLVRDSISSQAAMFFTNHANHFPQTPCEQQVPAHPCWKKCFVQPDDSVSSSLDTQYSSTDTESEEKP